MILGFAKTVSVHAQEQVASLVQEATIDYPLPYPGILSDHPLYFLKKIRDSILVWLIRDPIKKIEFCILQSDKETSAAVLLFGKDKKSFSNEAIVRAITFKTKAMDGIKEYKASGKETPEFIVERLLHSLLKQRDIQIDLGKKVSGSDRALFAGWNESISKLLIEVANVK